MHPLSSKYTAELHKNSHKAVLSTDFVQEVESVLMLQFYVGLHDLNMPKLLETVID